MTHYIEKDISDKKLNKHHIQQLVEIGMAISSEKNVDKLLEKVLNITRELSNADAGTLYIVDKEKKYLIFRIIQNQSLNLCMAGKDEIKIKFPPVPMEINNQPNLKNVSSYVAITGKSVNIIDVNDTNKKFDFSGHEEYDSISGYTTKSMLVIPLKNHKNVIIGVIQLINAQDHKTKKIIPFSSYSEYLINALASQAAVALTNAQLIQSLKNLLSAFIKSMAMALGEKSPYTGKHIERVVDLTMLIAKAINKSDNENFIDVFFNENELEELHIAAWLHDIGKIVTPECVIDKAKKLEKTMDRIDLIEMRFQLIETLAQVELLNKKNELLNKNNNVESDIMQVENNFKNKVALLRQNFDVIKSCNNTGEFMTDEKIEQIKAIAKQKYVFNNKSFAFLKDDEVKNLCIRKGTLTDEERLIIENHASMTYKIIGKLPFPDHLSRVSEFASGHHERPDGTGYPQGLSNKKLAIQSRILAIAGIFEALTAKDRPYRKPISLSRAIKIMNFMKKDNHIDGKIYDLFINTGVYKEYVSKILNPEQIDIDI